MASARGAAYKDLGSRRYAQDIAHLTRCRTGIALDTALSPESAALAFAQIDALISTLADLKRQRETNEASDEGRTGTDNEPA
jgi:hypothetical protein